MDDEVQRQILQEARANCLDDVRRRLLRAWIDLVTFSGLEGLADVVEAAHDDVAEAWKVAVREAGGEEPADRLREALDEAVEVG